MAFKGTATRSARDIAEAIEAAGGEMNAETSVDHTIYYVRMLKDDIGLGLDVLSDIVANSLFDPEELKREQHVISQEIGAAADVPEDLVFDMFQEAAYPDQPIGRTILGTPASVQAITDDDLRRFLATHYRGPQMVLSAAGNLDHASLAAAAEERLGGLGGGAAPAPQPGRYRGGHSGEAKDLQEAQIMLGFEGPSFLDADYHATHLLSAILGGGMASRLFQEVREERGLCYSIHSFFWPYADTGIFGVEAATSEEDLEELMDVVVGELARIAGGVAQDELARAKAQTRSGLLMALESPLARAGQMARHILIYGRPIPLDEIVAKIEAVTPAAIAAAAERIFATAPTLASIGPIGGMPSAADVGRRLQSRS